MPSERQLATYYDVRAPTIREAIWALQLYLQQRAASHPENRVVNSLCQPQGVQPKPLPLNSVCVSAVLPDRQALVETPAADPDPAEVAVLPVITGEALGFALVTVVLGVSTGIGLELVKVPAGVVAAPGKAVVVIVGVVLCSAGSETAPLPTWP